MSNDLYLRIKAQIPFQYREILSHFSYVFSFQVARPALGFISFFFVVHYVPKDIIGHYHFVLSFIALVSITALPGMRGALMQSIARGKGGFFKIASRYSFLGAVAGSLILCILGGYFYWNGDIAMTLAFGIAALFNPLSQGLMAWRSSYTGTERFKLLSVMDTLGTFFISLFLVASVFLYTSSHVVLLSIAVIIPAFQNFILWFNEYQKYIEAPQAEEGMREYGLKTSAYQVFPTVAKEVDKLTIYGFMSAGDLAAYNVAMKIPEAVKSIFQNLGYVITPKFARMKNFTQRLDEQLRWLSVASFFLIVAFALTLFPPIFMLIVPDNYADSLLYSQVLLCSVAIGNHAILRAKYIKSRKDSESYRRLMVAGTIIKIITAPVLVFFIGVWGAVISILLQRILMSSYTEYLVQKTYHVKL